ncbi:MAG TPA: hypothetical protein VHF69_13000, partial [Candidatus Synoicihabitans sp.]|nr:hypothetical protein [Candidatus Synoicihabitans sp.]
MACLDTPTSRLLGTPCPQRADPPRATEAVAAIARDGMSFAVVAAGWSALGDRPLALGSVVAFAGWAAVVRAVSLRLFSHGAVGSISGHLAADVVLLITAAVWPGWAGEASPFLRAGVAGLALLVAAGWWMVVRLAAPGNASRAQTALQCLLLVAISIFTWSAYFTSHLVGVVDERWYVDVMEEFIERARTGRWPVWAGEGPLNWNGNVHHFRSAPWQLHLGAIIDLLTFRALSPVALNHLTVILSHQAALLALFVGLR